MAVHGGVFTIRGAAALAMIMVAAPFLLVLHVTLLQSHLDEECLMPCVCPVAPTSLIVRFVFIEFHHGFMHINKDKK
jgi:hypothetical protein